jgi:sulfonate transport system substrate-binding protein
VLRDGTGLVDNHGFYLAPSGFLQQYPQVVDLILEAVGETDAWITTHPAAAAQQLAGDLGVTPAVLERAIRRSNFGPKPLTPEVIAAQQRIADTLHEVKLIPKQLVVRDAVWNPGG